MTLIKEATVFGRAEHLFEREHLGIYRLCIAPGLCIPVHIHHKIQECEMVLTKGLLRQQKEVKPGSARCWPQSFPHGYENPTAQEQAVLCIDQPKFFPEDEVVVKVEHLTDVQEEFCFDFSESPASAS